MLIKSSFLVFDKKTSLVHFLFLKVKIAAALRPVSFELHSPFCYPLNIDFGSFVEGITMKKLFLLLFSLFWSFSASSAPLSFDIHTPNEPKSMQVAKVYFLPDWRDKGMFWDGADEKPCTEVCPQKTDYDCKYGTESYVNGCGLTCSRCVECSGCEEQGYTLSECPVNGICLNDCCNKLYKITDCNSGYVLENGACRAENCTENASLCDSTTEKCGNGQCVEKDCTEYPDKCGSNQVCVNGECIAKDCNNTPSLCTATEKCLLQDGVYKCVCSPTCTDESDCSNGTETIANGCGGECTVCKKGPPAEAVIFTFSPDTANVTLTLPTASYSGITADYTVDWGDGTVDKNLTTLKPTHTYAEAGSYDVTITGSLGKLGQISSSNIKYVTQIKQLNLSSIRNFAATFEGGTNIRGNIPELPLNLESAGDMFYECKNLTGRIPKFPPKLSNGSGMFYKCSGLSGSIPELPAGLTDGDGMFTDCAGLTGNIPVLPKTLRDASSRDSGTSRSSFGGMFGGCRGLTGNIPQLPEGLLYADGMFKSCTGLTGSIPQLPTKLQYAKGMFEYCSNLTGNIPELPASLTDGSMMFSGCSGLTGSIPELPATLKRGYSMFEYCSSLTGNIPELPASLEDVARMFFDCRGLTGNIPKIPASLTDTWGLFHGCSNLTGTIPELPAGLTDGSSMFSGCSKLTGTIPELPAGLTDGGGMFEECSGLTGNIPALPVSLVAVNVMFKGCRSLTGVTTVNGQYPYQYLINAKTHGWMVDDASEAVRQHFPTSWGGTCTTCQ